MATSSRFSSISGAAHSDDEPTRTGPPRSLGSALSESGPVAVAARTAQGDTFQGRAEPQDTYPDLPPQDAVTGSLKIVDRGSLDTLYDDDEPTMEYDIAAARTELDGDRSLQALELGQAFPPRSLPGASAARLAVLPSRQGGAAPSGPRFAEPSPQIFREFT